MRKYVSVIISSVRRIYDNHRGRKSIKSVCPIWRSKVRNTKSKYRLIENLIHF